MGITVFKFHERRPDKLSYATLINAPDAPLPDHFIICSSHKQQQIGTLHTRNIYVLYKDSNFSKSWLSIGFQFLDEKKIWLYVNEKYMLGSVTTDTLISWVHICVEVNTINGTIRGSINGGNVSSVHDVKGLTPVPQLYLRLGVVKASSGLGATTQFFGSVSNVNLFTIGNVDFEENLLSLTSSYASSCKLIQSYLYLSWSNTDWSFVGLGKGFEKMEIDEKILCSKVLHFKLPFPWNKKEATEECRKFGNAKISEVSTPSLANVSDQDLENIYGPYGERFHDCELFWTPFTDEGTEGSFVHEITNENIRYILHTNYTGLPSQNKILFVIF